MAIGAAIGTVMILPQLGDGAEPARQAGRLVGGALIGLLIGWGLARLLKLPK